MLSFVLGARGVCVSERVEASRRLEGVGTCGERERERERGGGSGNSEGLSSVCGRAPGLFYTCFGYTCQGTSSHSVMANETTPVRAGAAHVPYGHVISNEKWKGSQIAQGIQGKVKLILEDGLGVVDFHLSNRSCVLYISEADLVAGNGFRRRLVRFRNACTLQGIVIVEKTQISDQYFPAVQKFVVLELGMTLLPVANQGEAAQLIIQLVHEQAKDRASNPFLNKKCPKLLEVSVFQTVQQIPGVGKTKALLLLEQFGNLHQLCNASVQELEQVVGRSLAQQIYTFFTQTE